MKSARPITLPERDLPFRDFIETLTRGAWSPPNHHNIKDKILLLSAKGQLRFQHWFQAMVVAGVKPSMAGDIWSHGGCSLMGICFYGINDSWKMDEWLVAATPFGSTRHTGEAIDEISAAALRRQGVQWRENGTVYEAVHAKVSDNASNMAKGWRGFDGGFCADHTLELSVHKYTGETTVARSPGPSPRARASLPILPSLHGRHPGPDQDPGEQRPTVEAAGERRRDPLVLLVRDDGLVPRAEDGGADVRY